MPTNNTPTAYNKYLDSLADSRTGNPIPNVSVWVFDTGAIILPSVGAVWNTALQANAAILYTSETNSTPVAQPLTTNANGEFLFYAPYGRYDLVYVRRGIVIRVQSLVYVTGINSATAGNLDLSPPIAGHSNSYDLLEEHEERLDNIELPTGNVPVYSPKLITIFDTIAALRAFTGYSVIKRAQPLGYYTVGDGGGGPVRHYVSGAAAGTYVDNGGSIIVPTGGDGSAAWVYDTAGKIFGPDFGLLPGRTDSAARLAACINALPAAGGTIEVSPGTYRIMTGIVTTKSNLSIVGLGSRGLRNINTQKGSVVFEVAINGGYGITYGDGVGQERDTFTIKNIMLTPASGFAPAGGLRIKASSNWILENFAASGFISGTGLFLDGTGVDNVIQKETQQATIIDPVLTGNKIGIEMIYPFDINIFGGHIQGFIASDLNRPDGVEYPWLGSDIGIKISNGQNVRLWGTTIQMHETLVQLNSFNNFQWFGGHAEAFVVGVDSNSSDYGAITWLEAGNGILGYWSAAGNTGPGDYKFGNDPTIHAEGYGTLFDLDANSPDWHLQPIDINAIATWKNILSDRVVFGYRNRPPLEIKSRTLSGDISLTWVDAPTQLFDPSGADRSVTIPAATNPDVKNFDWIFVNTGSSGNLKIQVNPSTKIGIVPPGGVLFLQNNGIQWFSAGMDPSATTGELDSATSAVNTFGKYRGKMVFNSTSGQPVWSTGATAGSFWRYADGTNAHQPL
jgi:hypothetical protein